MTVRTRGSWRALLLVVVFAGAWSAAPQSVDHRARVRPAASTRPAAIAPLPDRLTDQQFWQLSSELSEPAGYFRSENLVSNEHTFQYVIPALQRQVRPGGVYLGVAPDQNFTYMIATDPRIAFIVDVRRGNLLEHLMYKALIELSSDRADFISRLFSKKRPADVGPQSSVVDLFMKFDQVPTSDELYRANIRTIRDHLVKHHGFPLSDEDLDQLESIYFAFFWDGPSIRYSMTPGFGGRTFGTTFPSYEDLAMQTDWDNTFRSYLASEDNFRKLKALEEKNLIVPVVGNFAGPKALRAVGEYIRQHGAVVSAFYVSNVEQYLFQDGLFEDFVRNIATLPIDDSSTFIRSVSARYGYQGSMLGPDGRASALDPIRPFLRDFDAGRIRTYFDVNARSK
jgi:hypothetical protein